MIMRKIKKDPLFSEEQKLRMSRRNKMNIEKTKQEYRQLILIILFGKNKQELTTDLTFHKMSPSGLAHKHKNTASLSFSFSFHSK